jgi:hypothetical protein
MHRGDGLFREGKVRRWQKADNEHRKGKKGFHEACSVTTTLGFVDEKTLP